jgi:hypothetical protein
VHTAGFKAKVALAAVKELEDSCEKSEKGSN